MKNKIILLFVIILVGSCYNNDSEQTIIQDTGINNKIIVVADSTLFNSALADTIKQIFEKKIVGVFPEEKMFNVKFIERKVFDNNNIFKKEKNIIIISESKDDFIEDKWDKNQAVVYLNLNSKFSVFAKKAREAFKFINQKELTSIFNDHYYNHNEKATKDIFNKFGIEIFVPNQYNQFINDETVCLAKYHASNQDEDLFKYLIVFEELPPEYMMSKLIEYDSNYDESWISMQVNAILQNYVWGASEGSYAKIDQEFSLIFENDIYRGMWHLVNDFGGGPIIVKTRKNRINNKRTIIIGLIYYPSGDTRNFLRTFEALF